jgi:hypothetical protein
MFYEREKQALSFERHLQAKFYEGDKQPMFMRKEAGNILRGR